jgi:hypothetical protein
MLRGGDVAAKTSNQSGKLLGPTGRTGTGG